MSGDEVLAPLRRPVGEPAELRWDDEISDAEWSIRRTTPRGRMT